MAGPEFREIRLNVENGREWGSHSGLILYGYGECSGVGLLFGINRVRISGIIEGRANIQD